MGRSGNKTGRSQPQFVQVYFWMMQTEAWATMPPGPRALYLEVKRQYISQGPDFGVPPRPI